MWTLDSLRYLAIQEFNNIVGNLEVPKPSLSRLLAYGFQPEVMRRTLLAGLST
jgi:hypothetical protein